MFVYLAMMTLTDFCANLLATNLAEMFNITMFKIYLLNTMRAIWLSLIFRLSEVWKEQIVETVHGTACIAYCRKIAEVDGTDGSEMNC